MMWFLDRPRVVQGDLVPGMSKVLESIHSELCPPPINFAVVGTNVPFTCVTV